LIYGCFFLVTLYKSRAKIALFDFHWKLCFSDGGAEAPRQSLRAVTLRAELAVPSEAGPPCVLVPRLVHRQPAVLQARVRHQPGVPAGPRLRQRQVRRPVRRGVRHQLQVRCR